MMIIWDGDIEKPEGAEPYSDAKLIEMHRSATPGLLVIGNPSSAYMGRDVNARKRNWVELHTTQKFQDIDEPSWSNDKMKGPVGLISGFGAEVGLKIASASVAKEMPSGAKNASILFINGPNLNLLGTRQPEIYGNKSLQDIFNEMKNHHPELEAHVYQSNVEGEIINAIQSAREKFDAIIINAGAFTHTSIAIHDALKSYEDIIIELHISNPHQRESFRHRSFISPVAHGIIAGFGAKGYELALMGAMSKL